MTWNLDLPPAMTIALRWHGQLKAFATAGSTVINKASVLAQGQTGIVGGTGSSVIPRNFSHLAPVVLPTTYISYVAIGNSDDEGKIGCKGYFITFFPLNKQTQFELRGIQHEATAFANVGGLSQSIGCLIGDCFNGFPGDATCTLGSGPVSPGMAGIGTSGCKVERTPAIYDPDDFQDICMTEPMINVYKVTSNAPVLWQLLTHIGHDANDNFTYSPSTTITYRGLMHYMFRRAAMDTIAGDGDTLSLINTGLDAAGNLVPTQPTTVHLFEFDYGTLTWQYMSTYDLGPESQAIDLGPDLSDENPWRTVSSDTQLIVYQGNDTINQGFCCCGCGDNFGGFAPNRENGNVVSQVGVGTFYAIAAGYPQGNKVVVGNTGAATATYQIFAYLPDAPVASGLIPSTLAGSSGSWASVAVDNVPPGLANIANPHFYGAQFDAPGFSLTKVQLISGGPIQVMCGTNIYNIYAGGAIFNAANGQQTGTQFWFNHFAGSASCNKSPQSYFVAVFCPKTGMAIQAQSELGYSATYTTNGPDQCVAFLAITGAAKENFTFSVLPGPASGNVSALYNQCQDMEKGYTAPFMQSGTHYIVIAPPTGFVGQNFWLTIVVIDNSQTTKTDYCGTTSFTSTDPGAKLEASAMDTYNYTWTSSSGCPGGTNNNGVRVFVNVTMSRIGLQTIVAIDTTDGSISGLTAIMIVGVDVKLAKSPPLSIAASGDTVQFRVCWSNYSSASAFSFTITDAVPMGTAYVPDLASNHLCGFSGAAVPVDVSYSTATTPTPPVPASFITTTGALPAGVRWLRWTVNPVNVNSTGCLCYRVTVN